VSSFDSWAGRVQPRCRPSIPSRNTSNIHRAANEAGFDCCQPSQSLHLDGDYTARDQE
jgi:hypothetical protein